MKKRSLLISILAGMALLLTRPKKVTAPVIQEDEACYPGTNIKIKPGDLLFSPIGKSESKYVGHVGIVNHEDKVVHSVPAGLIQDSVVNYCRKFRSITVFAPKTPFLGIQAADYLKTLYEKHSRAAYRVFTPLGSSDEVQYCTKTVWQCYMYGADVNLGNLSKEAKAIHPQFLKDKKYLIKKGAIR
ncbi:hypothetical protein GCM10010954_05710 [Halobacillus andaensis]|uniref:Permuted papain-like amidase enzyme, YaeF/YiiX, C92 family n=1 Tax=Halobacillus andaensis TaxID=1176239 RepID=A0A917EV57_HALAA|nr:hypothetical protein [Halobacillus andaensis]MBP2003360.1 uncharacterized protein YycO [Halobacillus andaensis]GGF10059.1 hypothetical protein GCM10010954_05710 [Halobacillus andaensis]